MSWTAMFSFLSNYIYDLLIRLFHESCYLCYCFFRDIFWLKYLMKINGYFGIFLYILIFKQISVSRKTKQATSLVKKIRIHKNKIRETIWWADQYIIDFSVRIERVLKTLMVQRVFGLAAPLPTTGRETASSIIVATMRLQPPRSMHNSSSTVINNSLDPGGNYPVLTVCGNSAYGNP